MPLKIDLKPGEKFVLNGAVVSVGRDGRSLLLKNEAVLLREKDVMQEEEANTPARRIYFTIMLMYIDPANKPRYDEQYQSLLVDFAKAGAFAGVAKHFGEGRSGCDGEQLLSCPPSLQDPVRNRA